MSIYTIAIVTSRDLPVDEDVLIQKLTKYFQSTPPNDVKEIILDDHPHSKTTIKTFLKEKGYRFRIMEPNWEDDGKSAAYKRSEKLATLVDAALVMTNDDDKVVHEFIANAWTNRVIVRNVRFPAVPEGGEAS